MNNFVQIEFSPELTPLFWTLANIVGADTTILYRYIDKEDVEINELLDLLSKSDMVREKDGKTFNDKFFEDVVKDEIPNENGKSLRDLLQDYESGTLDIYSDVNKECLEFLKEHIRILRFSEYAEKNPQKSMYNFDYTKRPQKYLVLDNDLLKEEYHVKKEGTKQILHEGITAYFMRAQHTAVYKNAVNKDIEMDRRFILESDIEKNDAHSDTSKDSTDYKIYGHNATWILITDKEKRNAIGCLRFEFKTQKKEVNKDGKSINDIFKEIFTEETIDLINDTVDEVLTKHEESSYTKLYSCLDPILKQLVEIDCSLKKECTELESKELARKIAELTKKSEKLTKEIAGLQGQKEEKETEIKTATEEREKGKKACLNGNKPNACEDAIYKIGEAKKEKEKIEHEIKEKGDLWKELNGEIDYLLKKKYTELESKKLARKIAELTKESEKLTKEIAELQGQKEEKETEIKTATEEREKGKKACLNGDKPNACEDAIYKIGEAKKEKEKIEHEIKEKDDRQKKLEAEINRKKQKNIDVWKEMANAAITNISSEQLKEEKWQNYRNNLKSELAKFDDAIKNVTENGKKIKEIILQIKEIILQIEKEEDLVDIEKVKKEKVEYDELLKIHKIIQHLFYVFKRNTYYGDSIYKRVNKFIEDLLNQLGLPADTFARVWGSLQKQEDLMLYDLQGYRDHFMHQFHVFIMGYIFIHKYGIEELKEQIECLHLNDGNKTKAKEKFKNIDVLRIWALTALFHDCGYSFEKLSNGFETFTNNTMHAKLESIFKWDEFFLKNQDIVTGLQNAAGYFKICPCNETSFSQADVFRSILQKGILDNDHGVISALILLQQFKKGTFDSKKDEHDSNFELAPLINLIVNISAVSIAVHNRVYLDIRDQGNPRICYCINPFAFILVYCDCLQEWGRRRSASSDKLYVSPRLENIMFESLSEWRDRKNKMNNKETEDLVKEKDKNRIFRVELCYDPDKKQILPSQLWILDKVNKVSQSFFSKSGFTVDISYNIGNSEFFKARIMQCCGSCGKCISCKEDKTDGNGHLNNAKSSTTECGNGSESAQNINK